MTKSEENNFIVELYDLTVVEQKNDPDIRPVTTRLLHENESISSTISRRADLNFTTVHASNDILKRGVTEHWSVSGLYFNPVMDATSGEVSHPLTTGSSVIMPGNKVEKDSISTKIGIYLVNQVTTNATVVPKKSLLMNVPSKIKFVMPEILVNNDFKLTHSTHFCKCR